MSGKIIQGNTPEQNRFVSISDFKWCMSCGGEGFKSVPEIIGIIRNKCCGEYILLKLMR